MTIDTRFLSFLLWGVGTVVVYGIVLWQQIDHWHDHHDTRSRREVVIGMALFMTALGAFFATALVLFDNTTGLRSFAVALSLGAFTGAGIIMADANRKRRVG